MNMIHYFCHKDKCFRIADKDKVIVHLARNTQKNFRIFCVDEQNTVKKFSENNPTILNLF